MSKKGLKRVNDTLLQISRQLVILSQCRAESNCVLGEIHEALDSEWSPDLSGIETQIENLRYEVEGVVGELKDQNDMRIACMHTEHLTRYRRIRQARRALEDVQEQTRFSEGPPSEEHKQRVAGLCDKLEDAWFDRVEEHSESRPEKRLRTK